MEAGYQILLTTFSGVSSSALSGNEVFPFLSTDFGTAGTLASGEFKAFITDM
jgi:hypothetical protein